MSLSYSDPRTDPRTGSPTGSLSADDVRNVEFTLARRGYDEKQVDDFLDRVLAAIEERDAALSAAATAPVAAEPREKGPQAAVDVLALAHRTAQEHIAAADATAGAILDRARAEAAEVAATAQQEAARIRTDAQSQHDEALEGLRRERYRLEQRLPELRHLVERAREDLETYAQGLLSAAADIPAEHPSGPHGLPAVSA